VGKGALDHYILVIAAPGVWEIDFIKVIDFRLGEFPEVFIKYLVAKMMDVVDKVPAHPFRLHCLSVPAASYPGVKN
jgi:hypothetical protein